MKKKLNCRLETWNNLTNEMSRRRIKFVMHRWCINMTKKQRERRWKKRSLSCVIKCDEFCMPRGEKRSVHEMDARRMIMRAGRRQMSLNSLELRRNKFDNYAARRDPGHANGDKVFQAILHFIADRLTFDVHNKFPLFPGNKFFYNL